MAELKTKRNRRSVPKFLKSIEHDRRRADCEAVVEMMREITGCEPAMWGDSIIGFGSHHYVYESGREGDWPVTAVSPRRQNLVLYIMPGFEAYDAILAKLGKHRTGRACLYINKLEDVHLPTLKRLIRASVKGRI